MDEKTKKIISYVLSTLIVGGIMASLTIDPYNGLVALLAIILLALQCILIVFVAKLLYNISSSNYFQKKYRKYKSKHERQ